MPLPFCAHDTNASFQYLHLFCFASPTLAAGAHKQGIAIDLSDSLRIKIPSVPARKQRDTGAQRAGNDGWRCSDFRLQS